MKKATLVFLCLVILITSAACGVKQKQNEKENDQKIALTAQAETPKAETGYVPLNQLPEKYGSEAASKNGDVVRSKSGIANLDKLDRFIEAYKSNNAKAGDMVRITEYTDEGDAVVLDLVFDGKVLKLFHDSTRDKFSSPENRVVEELTIASIVKEDNEDGTRYTAKTNKGEERYLFYARKQ